MSVYATSLKVSFRFLPVSFQINFTKNQMYLVSTATFYSSFAQLLYVVFVKLSDRLFNYLMFGQTLSELKMETLKTHEFHPW